MVLHLGVVRRLALHAPCHGFDQRPRVFIAQLLGAANRAQTLRRTRKPLARLDEYLVRHHPLARQVAPRRRALAPGTDLARHGQLAPRQRARALQVQVRLLGVARHARCVGKRRHLGLKPRKTVEARQLLNHLIVNARQVDDVVLCIAQLVFVKRAARPVGKRLRLGQPDAAVGLHQRAIANLLALAQKRRGELRVKDRRGHAAKRVENHLEVLRAGVEHLGDALVLQKGNERRKVADGQRVDGHRLVRRRHLNEAQLGVIGAFAQKLGVHGDDARLGRALAEG